MKQFNGKFSLMRDRPFKKMFNDPELFSDFMKSTYDFLEINEEFELGSLNSQVLLAGDNIKIKDFFCDVFAVTNNRIIILEAYNNFKIYEERKSYCYASRVYGSQLMGSDSYKDVKKVLCINIVNGKPRKNQNKDIEMYRMKDDIKIMESDPIIFVTIYLDNIRKRLYTLSEHRFIRYLRILCSSTVNEIKEISKGDKIMNKTINFINKFFTMPGNTRQDRIESDLETARDYGIDIGLKNKETQIINKLYSKNYSIQNISDTLDIPVEEVQRRLTLKK